MQLNKETIKNLSKISRIKLREDEVDGLTKDLKSIIGYFEELKRVNVEGVKKISKAECPENFFREDETRKKDYFNNTELLSGFFNLKKGFLKIPPVFKKEE